MATLIRTELAPVTHRYTLLYLLLLWDCLQLVHPAQTFTRHSSAAPIGDLTQWQQNNRHKTVNFQWKSADGSRLEEGIGRRDFVGPMAKHVHAVRRARRAAMASGQDGDIRKSAYVCEDGILRLSCTAGKHIDVLRANFGRFSITLCNPSGFLDWSVNCASGNSLSVLTQRCSGQIECSIQASSSIFGDPCPTTSKYLEVHYTCSSVQEIDSNRNSTAIADNDNAPPHSSNRGTKERGDGLISQENSLPGQVLTANQSSMGSVLATDKFAHKGGLNQDLLASSNYLNIQCNQPDSESNRQFASAKCKQMESLHPNRDTNQSHSEQNSAEQSTSEHSDRSPETFTTKSTLVTRLHSDQASDIDNDHLSRGNGNLLVVRDGHKVEGSNQAEWPASKTTSLGKVFSSCQPMIYRGIAWPQTIADSVSIRSCPPETSGPARWQCTRLEEEGNHQALWNNLPDLSRCNSRWLLELHSFQNVNNFRNDIWKSILTTLQRSTFYGADIVELNSLLHASLQNIFDTKLNNNSKLNLLTANRQRFTSFETLFETVSLLLDKDNAAWLDLPAFKREVTALNLLDIAVKYTTLFCLDTRHSTTDKEVIKEWPNLLISCFSISKLLHEFQLNWHSYKNASREFKFKLFTSSQYQPLVPYSNVTVYMVVGAANMANILNEDILFGTIIPIHLEHYFEVNANRTLELNLESGLNKLVRWEKRRPSRFVNSNVVKFFQFNSSQIVTSGHLESYWFEIVFKHSFGADWLTHECVHWDSDRNQWSTEQCTLLQSNGTHSICRCNIVSTCSLLATEHSTNKSDNHYMPVHLFGQENSILPLTLIGYMWIVLLLTRCHDNFFNRFNFSPLLLACIVRTSIELCLISTILWPEWSANWCQTVLFVLFFQMQTISSLLAVFIFQNAILTVLATKIYLSKNYANCLHALTKSRRLQIWISSVFALIHLALLYSVAERRTCWPHFGDTPIINLFLVLSPLLQMSVVVIAGVAFLHCSQKVFSDYGYPNLHCINLQTALLEKHVKDLFCSRCKHALLWTIATCVYLFGVVTSQCVGLSVSNLSISLIGLDIGLSLAFVLFGRLKYVSAIVEKCRQSTPTHCSSKDISSSSSIHGNSISILSESSKAFLTLPGQISLSKMLDSPKIYPSPHRSSSTYGRSCNPSMHLYESPKHLYKYECDRYTLRPNGMHANSNTAYKLSSNRNNLYPLRINSHLTPSSPLEPNSPIETNAFIAHDSDCAQSTDSHSHLSIAKANSTLRQIGSTQMYRSHFFDRGNFISIN